MPNVPNTHAVARVPESKHSGWTLQTLMDHVLTIISEKNAHVLSVILSHDSRYEERFRALQREIEQGLEQQKTEIVAALASADKAVQKAESAAEKRFEAVNEFRNTLSDQQRNLMPRSEVDVLQRALADKIGALETTMSSKINSLEKQLDAMIAERAGLKGGWGYAVGVVGFVLAIGSLIMIVFKFAQVTP